MAQNDDPLRIFAIGDIQGCFDSLQKLLKKISFDQSRDQLWFCGDLVNRGPDSLKTLRFIKQLGKSAVSVLGNHDLHLLALAKNAKLRKEKDTLEQILTAEDRDELLEWLRHRPLLHRDNKNCLVHAGIPPQWEIDQACQYAREVEAIIGGSQFDEFLSEMYGNEPAQWSESLSGWDKVRFIVNGLTRMRYCEQDGKLDFDFKGAPGKQSKHLFPWFGFPNRKNDSVNIIFGHWSTLGFHAQGNCFGLDTGCLWSGRLTALRLNDKFTRISIDCPGYKNPIDEI